MTGFPEQLKEYIREEIVRFREIDAKYFANAQPYKYLKWVYSSYLEAPYDFIDALRTGEYSFYVHEMAAKQIYGHNCTTIIPGLFTFCQELGLNPQICQFFEFRDIQKKEDKENNLSPHHFGVVVDIGKKYLLDPFFHVFGLITKEEDKKWRISGRGGLKSLVREFEQVVYYTEEDFAQMMERLHNPVESLDMLVAGQRVHKKIAINKVWANQMVYYDEKKRDVSTRLYFEQAGIQDKAIIQHHLFDEEGNIAEKFIDLYLAKDNNWTALVQEKKVARLTEEDVRKIRRLLGKTVDYKKQERMYKTLQQPKHKQRLHSLCELVDNIYGNLSNEEQEIIEPLIYARVLYETTAMNKDYIYSKRIHEEKLLNLTKEMWAFSDKISVLDYHLSLFKWKLKKRNEKKIGRLMQEKKKLVNRCGKVKEELSEWNFVHLYNKDVFHRSRDKVLFVEQELKGLSVDDMKTRVEEQGLDWRVGYIGLIADFIPFIVDGKDELELKMFMPSVQEKVRARIERDRMNRE